MVFLQNGFLYVSSDVQLVKKTLNIVDTQMDTLQNEFWYDYSDF